MEQTELFEKLIAQGGGDNPQLQAMLALMQQAQADNIDAGAESVEENELELCRERLTKAISKIKHLTVEVKQLNEALSAMLQFGEDLAHAVGACEFCWGEDVSCRVCRGRGKPGVFEPDPALFKEFVLPAYLRSQVKLQQPLPKQTMSN